MLRGVGKPPEGQEAREGMAREGKYSEGKVRVVVGAAAWKGKGKEGAWQC